MPKFFRLKQPLGPSFAADAEDTALTKHLLTDVGHFEIPSYGITPWPDASLFTGIDSFQRKKKLDVDSIMLPGGPTEKALNEEFAQTTMPDLTRALQRQGIDTRNSDVKPAILIPDGFFRRERNPICPTPWPDDKCDEQLENDLRRCSQIARGNHQLYRICQQSAMERYAACIAKRPLPPLYEG